MSPNRNFGDWHRSRYICTLLPGTAAGVAQVFLPAGARDFPVPCSDPPRHRAHASPDHPPSYARTRRLRGSEEHGTRKSRAPADKNVGATTFAFEGKRRGHYARRLLRPGTVALPDRARPRAQKRDFPRSSAQPNVYDRKATSARLRQQATRPLRLFVAAAADGRAPGSRPSSGAET
jgi:hypothetical protein